MKKLIAIACLASTVSLTAGTAMADNIKGKLGVTARVGFVVPAANGSDPGLVGGGGLIYGITDNIAGDMEITHSSFGSDRGDFGITDFSLGGQYRFALTDRQLVPYVGAGFDILVNDNEYHDVDTTVGAHVKAGVDYFLQKQLALTAEAKVVAGPKANISGRSDHFDPTNFSGTVGIRYFFN